MTDDNQLSGLYEAAASQLREERDRVARLAAGRSQRVGGLFDAVERLLEEDPSVPEPEPAANGRDRFEHQVPSGNGDRPGHPAHLGAGDSVDADGYPAHLGAGDDPPVPVDLTPVTPPPEAPISSPAVPSSRAAELWPPGTPTTVVRRPPRRGAPADAARRPQPSPSSPPPSPPPPPDARPPPPSSPPAPPSTPEAVRPPPAGPGASAPGAEPARMAMARPSVRDRVRATVTWARDVGFAEVRDPRAPLLSPARRRVARVALWARNTGALLVVFVAFQLWGTGLSHARSQHALSAAFDRLLARSPPAAATDLSGPAEDGAPQTGEAVARIKIPSIGVDQVVVEGTDVADLRKGPGHYLNTPLPGEPGNAAIAGHRTTFGAPFSRLDDLRSGDSIAVTTTKGTFDYTVDNKTVVSPSNNGALGTGADNRLTLTTCTPRYSAAKRLVVVAKLATPPAPAPVRATNDPGLVAYADQGGDPAAWVPTILWGILAGLVLVGTRRLSVNWARLPALALGAPFAALFLFECFQSLNLLLPANF